MPRALEKPRLLVGLFPIKGPNFPDLSISHTQLKRDATASANLSPHQTAYVLATVYWDNARTMLPVEEAYYLGCKSKVLCERLRDGKDF